MTKRIYLLGTLLSICLIIFSGCTGGLEEVADNNMIELHTWFFTSGVPNNAIKLNHTESDVNFICTVDKGRLWNYELHEFDKYLVVKTGSTIYWDSYDEDEEINKYDSVLEVVLKKDDRIIGYAIIEIESIKESLDYKANVLKSALFPKVNGQYQEVTEEYIKAKFEKLKNNKRTQE